MSYKTILVHVDESRHAAVRIKIAADFAMAEHAHLVGAAMTGISRYLYSTNAMGELDVSGANISANLDFLRERASAALVEFETIVKGMDLASHEQRIVDDEAGGGISLQARYCDLVVLGQTDPEEASPTIMRDFPEYVVMHCGRPALIVPYAGLFSSVGKRVLIAWDGSMAATRAITQAIPILRRAQIVQVVVFNASKQIDTHGEEPGADIALYLARHGIKVEVLNQLTQLDVGNALLSRAMDFTSDLIVMGAYVHSRFREILLGGVTRTVLESMTVPVLMAH